jgi:PAS domain-containing protein
MSSVEKQGSNEPVALIDILRSIHGELSAVVEVPICFFGLFDPVTQTVDVIWQVHEGVEHPGGRFPLGGGLTSQVIGDRRPRLVRQWSREGPRVQVQYAAEPPDLPESAMTVPVVFGDRVLGVLSAQSYQAEAFEQSDLEFMKTLASRAAPAIAIARPPESASSECTPGAPDLEGIVAKAHEAALALDDTGRLISMNQAARSLLRLEQQSVVFGFPIDRPQAGRWPLGSSSVSEALRQMLERLHGVEVSPETHITVHGDVERVLTCKASTVVADGRPVGTVMIFRTAKPEAA